MLGNWRRPKRHILLTREAVVGIAKKDLRDVMMGNEQMKEDMLYEKLAGSRVRCWGKVLA